MDIGDIVRLKQPFRPEPNCLEVYRYGVVVGWVEASNDDNQAWQSSSLREVIVQLYSPDTSTIYTDEFGTQPMFYFRLSELE